MESPVNSSSFVFFWPSTNGISSVTGPEPNRISGSPNFASSVATMRSQAIASSHAPPRHQPRTAAITGFGRLQTRIVTSMSCASSSRQPRAPSMPDSFSGEMSKPAENARPAPVSTTTLTSSSASARPSASWSPATISRLIALSLSGRLRVIQAAGPRRSYRTTSSVIRGS